MEVRNMDPQDYVEVTTRSGYTVVGRLGFGYRPTSAVVNVGEVRPGGPGPVHAIPRENVTSMVASTPEDARAYSLLTGAWSGLPANLTRDVKTEEWRSSR